MVSKSSYHQKEACTSSPFTSWPAPYVPFAKKKRKAPVCATFAKAAAMVIRCTLIRWPPLLGAATSVLAVVHYHFCLRLTLTDVVFIFTIRKMIYDNIKNFL
jgi:hypothetical protein